MTWSSILYYFDKYIILLHQVYYITCFFITLFIVFIALETRQLLLAFFHP